MANIGKPRPVKAINPDTKNQTVQKRRVTDFLPSLLNTDLTKKFFAGSGDHLYQPEASDKVVGFIGQVPAHAMLNEEFYINEPTKERQEYQLETVVISVDPDTGDTNNIMFYNDIVNLLRFQGGIVNNHDRLFETEYYSWAPCVDLDKLMNHTNYFWFPSGPDVDRITDLTDVGALIGSSSPITIQGIEFFDGQRIIFTNDVDISFNDRVFIVTGIGVSFDLITESSISQDVWDDPLVPWDEGLWDGADPDLVSVSVEPDYIVMDRGSVDGNPWSTGNKWFHRDELNDTQLAIALESQATRPIIEFCKNLELYNFGTFGRRPATVRDDITTDPGIEIVGQPSVTIDGIPLSNGDTILFTAPPTTLGVWGIQNWDNEDDPDGTWDPAFGATFSSPAGDITLGSNTITSATADFTALGFTEGMLISLYGTPSDDGQYTIASVSLGEIVIEETFLAPGLIATNVTITEDRILYQHRLFEINGLGEPGGATLTLIADGQNADGSPADGDKIKVLLGLSHQGNAYFWNDAEEDWILSQQKLGINQTPLFQLYDGESIQLQDPGKYPNSTFAGSRVFGYQVNTDPRQPIDTAIGIPLQFDQFGEILYENYLVTERYDFNVPAEEIVGFYYYKIVAHSNVDEEFSNDWWLSSVRTRQFLCDRFTITDDTQTIFELNLAPDAATVDETQVFVNGVEQSPSWTISSNIISFSVPFNINDLVQIRYFSSLNPDNGNATYEIPTNLEANPDNQEIDFISKSDFFTHFSEIIEKQPGFEGSPNGPNNWRNTAKDRSLGTKILQHRAPMLKLMGIGSNKNIDYMKSVRYVEREFARFRGKFLRIINEFFKDGIHTDTQPPTEWVEDALDKINLGKTIDFPFAYSEVGTRENDEPTFIPSTPSRLGVYSVYQPYKYADTTLRSPKNVLQLHDGSTITAYNDFRDDVILELEQNIYDSIPDEYKTEFRPDFDYIDYVNSEYRTSDYSREEFNRLLIPIIQRWATLKELNLSKNTDFVEGDPFTYNYSSLDLPGYWRGIFNNVYDTDRPNTHPWEMFGFSIKPDWWETRYGVAPYTNSNLFLWVDMQNGFIADGDRAGIDLKYARPGAPTPVDNTGNLIDPISLGLATLPDPDRIADPWKIGDIAPVESAFRRSEYWGFAIAQISYLMKPARFVEFGWDSQLQLYRYSDGVSPQWISSDTEDRKRQSEYSIHGEEVTDGLFYVSNGIQQWISDYVTSNGQDLARRFGNVIRSLQPKLGHKMAGFINYNATRVLADNFGLVPQEDVLINLYRNPSVREEIYSGVIIEKVSNGWAVYGYDVLEPHFNIIPGIATSKKVPITVGPLQILECTRFKSGTIEQVPYGTVFGSTQSVYDFLISYQEYLESRGWVFDEFDQEVNETQNWRLSGKQFLFWAVGRWANGSIISLSPSANKLKFRTDQGMVQSLEQIINGVYGLLDRDGKVIQPEETFISRFEDELIVSPDRGQAIYSARLYVAEIEHVITFNNTTIFDDLIYDPLYRLRQARLKLFTTRAGGWRGRLDAPGYIITDDGMIPNFEKTVTDFKRFFEIEDVVERPAIQDTARRVIGFQTRDYLDNLLLSDTTQFQFYQGFVRKKGTRLTLDRLFRSDSTTDSNDLQIFEEWAFRLGEFGALEDKTSIEFLLREEEVRGDPQLIEFRGSKLRNDISSIDNSLVLVDGTTFPNTGIIRIEDEIIFYAEKTNNTLTGLLRGQQNTNAVSHVSGTIVGLFDSEFDDVITISPNDNRWIIRPSDDGIADFPYREFDLTRLKRTKNAAYIDKITDVAIAGYALGTEVTHRVQTITERDAIFNSLRILLDDPDLVFGDLIWVDDISAYYDTNVDTDFYDDDPRSIFNHGFMVFRYTNTELTFDIPALSPINIPGAPTTIVTDTPHFLNNGDYVMIEGSIDAIPDINSSYNITNVTMNFSGDGVTTLFEMPGLVTLDPLSTIVTVNGATVSNYEITGGTETVVTSSGTPPFTYDVGSQISINGVTITFNTPIQPPVATQLVGIDSASVTLPATLSISDGIELATFVVLTGTDIDSVVQDINDAGVPNIVASKVSDSPVLSNGTGGTIVLDDIIGDAVNELFGVSAPYMEPIDEANVSAAIIDINAANIENVVATQSTDGRLVITETAGDALVIANVSGNALVGLGLAAGDTESLGTAIEFDTIPASGASIVVRRNNRFDIDVLVTTNGDYSNATIGVYTESRFLGLSNPSNNVDDRNNILYRDSYTTPQGNSVLWIEGEYIFVDNGARYINGTTYLNIRATDYGAITQDVTILLDYLTLDTLSDPITTFLDYGSLTDLPSYINDQGTTNENNAVSLWAVYTVEVGSPPLAVWSIATSDDTQRTQSPRVDTTLFNQSLIYNRDSNVTEVRLNIWDPAKGLFPSQVLKEIKYKLELNPAKYTDGESSLFQIDLEDSWDDRQVGEVWWDLSTVEFEQYETGSDRERRNKWGGLAPGKSIDIYEWVRSSVPPTEWAGLVDEASDQPESSFRYKPSGEAYKADEVEDPPYTQREVIDPTTGDFIIEYYFWVRNSETTPNISGRSFSVAQISRQMTNPTTAGVPWLSPINNIAIIASGVDQFITTNDSVLQMNFNITRSDVNIHREWMLGREGDRSDVPADRFWNKMRDSLVGFDQANNLIPDPTLESGRRLGNFIRPRQTWFIDRESAGKIFIECANDLLAQDCIVDTRGPVIFNSLFNTSPDPVIFSPGPGPNDFGFVFEPLTEGSDDFGFVDELDTEFDNFGLVTEPIEEADLREPCDYDYHVVDLTTRNNLASQPVLDANGFIVGPMDIGEQVWVDGTTETLGFWKVYQYDGVINGADSFTETCSEAYRVADYWTQVPFVTEGFSLDTLVDVIVETISERDAIVDLIDGLLVKVTDSNGDGSDLFAIYEYDSTNMLEPWILQAKDQCTIEFDVDRFYDSSSGFTDPRTITTDAPEGIPGNDQALATVINALRADILTDLEENLLFYKMVRYVHSEQLVVDWVFKTSYIKVVGLSKSATQDPIIRPSTTNSLIEFIEEAKPYHTKLRDFVINNDFGVDVHNVNATDFDKPVYFDPETEIFRVLDPNDATDLAILNDPESEQHDWFSNYLAINNPIRKVLATVIFDRVSCGSGAGWDPIDGWDFGLNEDWDLSLDQVAETAAERILKYYLPRPLSQEDIDENDVDLFKNIQETKNISSLISGCDFKGTIVDGGGHIIDINDIDTLLDGGPLANPGAPINPEDIIVDGNLFIQPTVDSEHPEELALASIGESISIAVDTLPAITLDGTPGATYTAGHTFLINGTVVDLTTGSTVDDAVVFVNDVSEVTTVRGVNVDGALRLLSSDDITLATGTGSALTDLGFSAGTFNTETAENIAFRLFLGNLAAKDSSVIKPLIKTEIFVPTTAGTVSPVEDIIVDRAIGFPERRATFLGDGLEDTFMSNNVDMESIFLLVTIDGVYQERGVDFTTSLVGSDKTIIFATPPADEAEIILTNGRTILVTSDNGDSLNIEFVRYSRVNITARTLSVINFGPVNGRGFNDTTPFIHPVGSPVILFDDSVPEIADFESYRISDTYKTTLTNPLNLSDVEIDLSSVAGLPKQTASETTMAKPGVIWLVGEATIVGETIRFAERIEYFKRDSTTLKYIHRGTQGTSASVPSVYNSAGELLSDFRTSSDFIYPAGTTVYNMTNLQKIPGGYKWEASPSGLQFSDSTIAEFLLDKPGSL